MKDIPEEKINEIAENFYCILYGKGFVIPRIAVKIRLQTIFGNKYFEKEYIEDLLKK